MLRKVEIKASGDTSFLVGELVDKIDLDELNKKLVSEGKSPAKVDPVLLGITKLLYKLNLLFPQPLSKKQQEF